MKTHHLRSLQFPSPLASLWAAALVLGAGLDGQAAAPTAVPLGSFGSELPGIARVATDAAGQIYVSSPQAGQVTVMDPFGRICFERRGFAQPLALAVDSAGHLYVSETRKGCVSVWDSQWNLASKLGQGEGEFQLPSDIAIDPASRDVFVCDSQANQIKAYRAGQRTVVFGGYGSGDGQFNFPAGLCVTKAGEVWVVDQNNDRIQVFNRGGSFLRAFSLGNRTGGSLGGTPSGRSQGIACDDSGRVYVADTYQGFIRVFDQQGTLLSTLGSYGERAGQLRSPIHLALDSHGRLLVASINNTRLELLGIDSYLQLVANPSQRVVAGGSAAGFSVAVSGPGPFAYQWRKDGIILPGATGSILAYAAVTAAQSGLYSVEVSGPAGSLVSPETTLSVQARPKISANPASQGVIAGAAITFDVAATGDALSYQWQRDGLDIPLATNRSWTLAIAQLVDAGLYQVRIANEVDAIVSNPARLSVSIPPPPPQLDSVSLQPDIGVQLPLPLRTRPQLRGGDLDGPGRMDPCDNPLL